MHTRQQPHTDRPPHRLGHPPLIHPPQPRLPPMTYPAHTTHKLSHDAEILPLLQRIHPQHIEHIPPVLGMRIRGGAAARDVAAAGGALAPFLLLDGGEVVGRVDVAGLETPVEVAFEVRGAVGGFGFGEGGAPGCGGVGLGLRVPAYGADEVSEVADGLGLLGCGGWWWAGIWSVR